MLPFLVGALSTLPQVTAATVDVTLSSSVAKVEATYAVRVQADSLTFVLIRLRDQEIHVTAVRPGPASMHHTTGSVRVSAPAPRGPGLPAVLRYEVRGNLQRIPIPVPRVPTDPDASEVVIRVHGVSPDARLTDGFPRLSRSDGEVVTARPANLPSFIRVPVVETGLSVNRLSDSFVIVLMLASSMFWLVRRRALQAAASRVR